MLKSKSLTGISLIMVVMLTLILAGCGTTTTPGSVKNDTAKSGNQTSGRDEKSIKVGVIGAFSGPMAEAGVPMRTAVELAAKEINDAGGIEGRMIELVAYDDEANTSKNTTLAKRAIDTDKVVALISGTSSGTGIATAKVSNEMQVPMITPVAQSPEVMQPYSPYVFRVTVTNPVDVDRLLKYAKEKNWKKIAVVHDTGAYGLSGEKILKAAIPAAGLELVANVGHKAGSTDLTAQVLEVKAANPDVILEWNMGADAAQFAKTMKSLGVKVPILAGRGLIFKVYTDSGKDAVEGTVATGALDFTRPDVQEWKEKYLQAGGSDGGYDFAAAGYDAMNVMGEALKKGGAANADDPQKVRDAIESITGFKSLCGYSGSAFNFAPNQHEGSSITGSVLQSVQNGKWVPLPR